ncbi:hypothetical protein DFH08DRAFT_1027037 [Mycena albidolilacea]|uniref:Uncharacterized protein n=1 Tax=Mycena albidolilacea TaxID=1033008 RepID=A0AAD6ZJL3_9AGAR|nr:hypothetical protein DFH08DRAFT_1027037 [Mycena albidolilacea]
MRSTEISVYVFTSLTLELAKSTLHKVDDLTYDNVVLRSLAVWFKDFVHDVPRRRLQLVAGTGEPGIRPALGEMNLDGEVALNSNLGLGEVGDTLGLFLEPEAAQVIATVDMDLPVGHEATPVPVGSLLAGNSTPVLDTVIPIVEDTLVPLGLENPPRSPCPESRYSHFNELCMLLLFFLHNNPDEHATPVQSPSKPLIPPSVSPLPEAETSAPSQPPAIEAPSSPASSTPSEWGSPPFSPVSQPRTRSLVAQAPGSYSDSGEGDDTDNTNTELRTPPLLASKAQTVVIDLDALHSSAYASPFPPHPQHFPTYDMIKQARREALARDATRRGLRTGRDRPRSLAELHPRVEGDSEQSVEDFQPRAPLLVAQNVTQRKRRSQSRSQSKGGRGADRARLVFASASASSNIDSA